MIWHITNQSVGSNSLYSTNLHNPVHAGDKVSVFIDGYIIPRLNVFDEYRHISPESMIKILYRKVGFDCIHYVKGVFVLIIFQDDKFFIFNDRHSIKKYFIFENNDYFYISNSLKKVSKNCNLSIDKESAAVFSLISHFINGDTLFRNLSVCQPAEIVKYESEKLRRSFFWHPKKILINRRAGRQPLSNYALSWKRLISSYISYLKPKDISLTLTGGNDSRMVMAALLSLNAGFHTFSFGNPLSYDCVVSKEIVENLDLLHNNYFVEEPTCKWFYGNARDIVRFGNSLVNIHRAHRNDAIIREKSSFPKTEMLFTGLVGGEYLKEPDYDDIAISHLFKKIMNVGFEPQILKNMLSEKGIIIKNVNIRRVFEKIFEFIAHAEGLTKTEKKFVYTYLFYGCSHHTQDSNVFGNQIKYVVNPFMDIDFLEIIAGYEKWYLNRRFPFFLNKAFHSELLVGITDFLSPELSNIPYAKKGKYTANDLLNNKGKYIFKRLSYFINQDRGRYPPNFPMGYWLYVFCKNELEKLKLNAELSEIYNLNMIDKQLENIKNQTNEESWHILTNPINVNLNYEYYKTP